MVLSLLCSATLKTKIKRNKKYTRVGVILSFASRCAGSKRKKTTVFVQVIDRMFDRKYVQDFSGSSTFFPVNNLYGYGTHRSFSAGGKGGVTRHNHKTLKAEQGNT